MNEELGTYIANAIRWARERLGSTDYPFLCLAFVEDAYEESNQVEIFGGSSAKESADEYQAARNTGEPPLGAFVFYDCAGTIDGEYKNWGHVGLYSGEGKVIHAWDKVRVDDFLDVQSLSPASGWTKPRYLGWAPIERVFVCIARKQDVLARDFSPSMIRSSQERSADFASIEYQVARMRPA